MKPGPPLHRPASLPAGRVDPFPKPGTKWRALHRLPHDSNKFISIRRFISLAKQKSS